RDIEDRDAARLIAVTAFGRVEQGAGAVEHGMTVEADIFRRGNAIEQRAVRGSAEGDGSAGLPVNDGAERAVGAELQRVPSRRHGPLPDDLAFRIETGGAIAFRPRHEVAGAEVARRLWFPREQAHLSLRRRPSH